MTGLTNKEVLTKLKKLKSRLNNQFKIQKFMLFGSRARDDWLLNSDVNIILISSDFKKLKFKERSAEVIGHWDGPIDLEPLCYTPEEFKRKSKEIGIVRQAIKDGIRV